jgi:hypothetical protein
MNDEIDDEILEAELGDDALEKKMKKIESEAARILKQSSELLKALTRDSSQQEETNQVGTKQEESKATAAGESIKSS